MMNYNPPELLKTNGRDNQEVWNLVGMHPQEQVLFNAWRVFEEWARDYIEIEVANNLKQSYYLFLRSTYDRLARSEKRPSDLTATTATHTIADSLADEARWYAPRES